MELDVPLIDVVHAEGLEPPRLAAPDPKSGAATNYATRAGLGFSNEAAKLMKSFDNSINISKYVLKLFGLIRTPLRCNCILFVERLQP